MDPKKTVRAAYDLISRQYRNETFDFAKSGYRTHLGWLTPHLSAGARVLDIGCGCGIPVARELARDYAVTGIDISPVQIARAREYVPSATFLNMDIMDATFAPASFDAVVAFYSIINMPREEHPILLDRATEWLREGGFFLGTVGDVADVRTETDWLGVEGATMYWSYESADTYRRWLIERGFRILQETLLVDGVRQSHPVLLAQKSAAAG